MAADGGWQGQLVRDRHGEPAAIVAVRVGPTWTDAVAIEGEHQTVAMRFRTHDGDGWPSLDGISVRLAVAAALILA